MERDIVEIAEEIAREAHANQTDLQGNPYLGHIRRVASAFEDPVLRAAALLHDTLEDTDLTADDLVARGVPAAVVGIVETVTRRDGKTYDEFIDRIAESPLATRVKIADLKDNLGRNAQLLDGDKARRLRARYERALQRLAEQGPASTRPFGEVGAMQ